MNRLILALSLCLALPLPACAPTSIESASTVSAKTVIAANQIYTSASRAGATLVLQGLLDKAAYQRADAKAYAVLIDVRAGRATLAQLTAATAALTGAE